MKQPGRPVQQAIVAEGLSKRFNLTLARSSFKDRLFHHRSHTDREDFWALKEMDLSVAQGETVGILGHNGSGKSTLLKCVAGILKPTTGRVQVRGRMASLLELGAGFHPDLSGRENIFINASFLAIPKKEIARRFDEIVAFAELEAFIDQQVKHYSSGMVHPARVRRRHQRRSGAAADRRGAVGRRRGVPVEVPRPHRGVPTGGSHDPLRHPLGRAGAAILRPRRGARTTARRSPTANRPTRSGSSASGCTARCRTRARRTRRSSTPT